MINFVTNREYSGKNVDILMASGKGSEFAGFHQGKKFFGVTGNQLKGMKAVSYTHLRAHETIPDLV